jgi:hypothetical protein
MTHSSTSAILLTVHICFVIMLSGCKAKLVSVDKGKYPTTEPKVVEELSARGASEFVSPEEVAQKGGIEEIDLEDRLNKEIQLLIAEIIKKAEERASLPDKLHSINRR